MELVYTMALAAGAGLLLVISGIVASVRASRRARQSPRLPPAKIHDGEPHRPEPERPASAGGGRIILGGLATVVFGLAAWFFWSLTQINWTKGRLLRLRGRARLCRRARGKGWHDAARPDVRGLSWLERSVLGEAWLYSARMEHASIPAFAQLGIQLAALGAPAALLERSHLAALDELRHATRCFAIARAYSGREWTAGPIAELASATASPPVSFERLACGSLIDGCLAEGIASDVAGRGATTAADPVIRDTLAMISSDELAHAEIAWDVVAWCIERGGARTRAAIASRLEHLANELSPRVPDLPGMTADRLARHGLVSQDALDELARARVDATISRARSLVGGTQRRAA